MKRRFLNSTILTIFAVATASFIFMSCQSKTQAAVNEEVAPQAITPESIANGSEDTDHKPMSVADFDKAIASEKLTMVDFYTTWCGPCKMMAPFIAQIKNEQSAVVNVLKIDAEAQIDIASRYNLEGYPTVILFKKGEVIFKQLGALDKDGLMALVNKYK